MGNWWLAASSRQCTCSCITSHAEFFGEISNHPGDSAHLQPRFGTLWLLAFPQTKIIFEREEISDVDEIQENTTAQLMAIPTKDFAVFWSWRRCWEICVGSQGAYFEGDWGIIVLQCFLYLVSSSTSDSFIFWTDLMFRMDQVLFQNNQSTSQTFGASDGSVSQPIPSFPRLDWQASMVIILSPIAQAS